MENIGKSNAWEPIYEYLRDQIIYGHLSPREKLDEKQISNKMSVSRTPVREAFKQLQAEGYITIIPQKGSFVTEYSSERLDDIYKILVKLEGLAVNMAGANITTLEFEKLQRMNEKMRQLSEKNAYKKYLEENIKFHMFFYDRAKNIVLKDVIGQLRKKVFRDRYLGITIPGNISKYVKDHQQILNSLKRRRWKLASRYMEIHVDRVRKTLLDYYSNFS
jgi:DNA-binding GntR family transcriptional regulator